MNQIYNKIVLDNGLKIVSHKMPGRESVALGIWINVGGRYEDSKNKGISHFLEHLLFKGTRKFTCRQLKESIEGVGGSLNGFTSEELTCYLVKLPASYLKIGLNILSDMVINPTLPAREIEKEKTVILEELKMYRDLPQSYVYELLDELLWPKQPLGESIIGTVESVSRVNRSALTDFKNKYYTVSNMVISAAGNFEHKDLEQSISKLFSSFKMQGLNGFSKVIESQDKPRLKFFEKATEQTHVALGFKSFRRNHPLKHALGLLHVILGANMSSRLFNEVREKRGLAYEIGTQVKRYQDTGAFIVHAGIDNKKVCDAIQLILKEIKRISKNLVTADEFRRAKEFYVGQLKLGLEDTLEHMLWIGETNATLNRTFSLNEIIAEVERVDRSKICEVAAEIFREDNLNLSLIGPLAGAKTKLYKNLHLG
ncbi:MAG: pitrilysin family protein [Candidatus Omnitrophica bacterium]|nr:pitrilysin family protein [Candidatus Omnitrophota bacterium]